MTSSAIRGYCQIDVIGISRLVVIIDVAAVAGIRRVVVIAVVTGVAIIGNILVRPGKWIEVAVVEIGG